MSSPSGAGKTTLSRKLLSADKNVTMSVSVTTRAPRPGETDGRDYHFISKERFAQMRDRKELLEWAEVFGNYYGTPRKPVDEALAKGLSNDQIAKELWVSQQTVKFHLSNIYRKLGVGNRTEATRFAYRNGMIE